MSENGEKLSESSVERSEASELKSLERKNTQELSKAELEKGEKDLAQRGEAAERKLSAASEKEKLERENDLSKEKGQPEKAENKSPQIKYSAATKKQKKAAYKTEIRKVQAQLPRASKAFSKVVHNPIVERASEVSGKTIFRPSALLGGAVFGLLTGVLVYLVALYLEYAMPNWILPLLLVVGAIFGILIEVLFVRSDKAQE